MEHIQRIHLHKKRAALILKKNGFTGYFETGEINSRTYSLQLAKIWANIKVKDNGENRIISGYVYFCPILILAFIVGVLDIIFAEDIAVFMLVFIVCFGLFIANLKEEKEMIECIKNTFLK